MVFLYSSTFCISFLVFTFALIFLAWLFYSFVGIGRNFVDPVPLDDYPAIAETVGKLAGTSLTSKFQTSTIVPGVFSAVLDVYEDYVPRPVPRGPRSVAKRGQVDSSSSSLPASKKSRQSSTLPGTPVIGSVLLGEHINMFGISVIYLCL